MSETMKAVEEIAEALWRRLAFGDLSLNTFLPELTAALQAERSRAEQAVRERDGLRAVVERLGSSEAFTSSHYVDGPSGKELIARLDYARRALAKPALSQTSPDEKGG